MSKELAKEQARDRFLSLVRGAAKTWAGYEVPDELERCNGVVFTIMNIIDGSSGVLPASNIVARPHPDDKDYHIAQGEHYIPDGLVINDDCLLHELYQNLPDEEAQPTDMAPRALTKEEVRSQVLDVARNYAQYWSELPDRTPSDRCNGLCFSLMNIFDGTSASLPAFDIIMNGQAINDDCALHEMYYQG
jgi:hypothetical protein